MRYAGRYSRIINLTLSIALVLSLGATSILANNSKILNLSGTSESTDPYLDLFDQYPYGYPYDGLYPIPEPDLDALKTDRFIVKYKENQEDSFKSKLSSLPFTLEASLTIDSVRDSLEQTAVLPDSLASDSSRGSSSNNELRSSDSSRYTNIEVLILSEKIDPSEFEEMLISSGAYDDIVYVQPDYALEIANLDPPPTSTALLGSGDDDSNSSSTSSPDDDGLSDDDPNLSTPAGTSDDTEEDDESYLIQNT